MNTTIDLMNNHRSIRKFTDEPISSELLQAIIEAAGMASTSNYIQAYSIIHVTDKDKRAAIAELAGSQKWVELSPVFMVFCADLLRGKSGCIKEGVEPVTDYTEQLLVATVDVSLVGQNAMLAAESLGLGGVFIGGIRNNPQKVCDLLEIPDNVYPVFGMCLGYPARQEEQKPRLPVEAVLMENAYNCETDFLDEYNKVTARYYEGRSANTRYDTWTRQISDMMSKPSRPHMKEFLRNKGFGHR